MSSAHAVAQQLMYPIFNPFPECCNLCSNGSTYILYKSALNIPHCRTPYCIINKGNNKFTELRAILQRESQNS